MGRSYRRRDGNHREVSIKFDIRSVGIFDVVSARLGDGEVFDSAKLKNTVRFLIENDMRNVVIDLGNLEYLYSDTINAFIASNRHMLEVSGRIAILTEHPKVQDILKRAGLDNIMRIYRSEAEMIADSKEILRQTSSYRIEELQKISTQPQEAPPAPRTEFDDFKLEMGARLGSKLDNNEVPQYQLGLNQTPAPAAFGNPPAGRDTAAPYPSFNAPGFNAPAAPEAVPAQGQPGYVPSQPAPAFGSFGSAQTFGGTANGSPAFGGANAANSGSGYGAGSVPQQPSPANFDFPTVQLPVGSFGASTQPISSAPAAPPTGYPAQDGEDVDPRSRKPSQERMRSPNARRQQGRRVGGREYQGGMEDAPETGAYAEELSPESVSPAPAAAEPYSGGYTPPPMSPNSLLEENRSSMGKFIMVGLAIAVVAIAAFFFLGKDGDKDALPENVPSAAAPAESPVVTPAPEAAAPADPAATASATPAAPATPPAPEASKPAQPPAAEKPKAEPPVQVAKVEPKAVAPRPTPAKKPRAEKPKAAEPGEDVPAQPAAVPQGKLRVTSTPPGAEVLVNYAKKGNTPTDISLLNNTNKIIVRLPGYKRFETTLPKNHPDRNLDVSLEREEAEEPVARVPESKPEPAKAAVKPPEDDGDGYEDLPMKAEPPKRAEPVARQEIKPKAEAAPTPGDGPIGVIFLSSSPARADIIIDGKNTGKKTPAKVELPSGSHRIEMVKSGQKAVVDQNVNEGKNKALHLTLQ